MIGAAKRLLRRPPNLDDVRAAWWAWVALRSVRNQLRDGAVRDVDVPDVPSVTPESARAMRRVLARHDPSCFERSLVLQAWLAAHGTPVDVVVGTEGGARAGFAAHAWLDGEPQPAGRHYVEMLRIAPRARS
jgi:hypothetical protein